MNPQFLAMLPGELQATVQEAEKLAGCEIAVVPDTTADESDNLAIGIVAGVSRATIAYRGDTISRCALLHEVLHVKRYWLDAVPTLRPAARRRYDLEAEMLDGLIEHLVIIPEERRFAEAESNAHWTSVMAEMLAELLRLGSWPSQVEVDNLQRSLLLQRAMMDIALPHLDHTGLYDRLHDENLLDASTAFVEGLRTVLNDKLRALSFVIQAFRYDPTGFRVGRYNLHADPKSFDPL